MGTQDSDVLNLVNGDENLAQKFIDDLSIDTLARTIWGEARNQSQQGMEAIAHVILNRMKMASSNNGTYWWGHDIISVCQKPYQFSCWNMDDPNRAKVMAVDEKDIHFVTCKRIARRAVFGTLGTDITHGADHYHTKSVTPKWSKGQTPCATIGDHLFFKLEG